MDRRQSVWLVALVLCAALVLLTGGGVTEQALALLEKPGILSFLMYLETGRIITAPLTWEKPPAQELPSVSGQPSKVERPSFQARDAALVDITALCDYPVDKAALLCQPLSWDLTQNGPAVLILHTHATESYTPAGADRYEATAPYRTLEEDQNMLRVGEHLATLLRRQGIQVLHDKTLHDYPNYNGSYNAARRTMEKYLQAYPSIELVLDIHRDAADLEGGAQLTTLATVNGQKSSQLMMVVGTDAGGLRHPQWQKNMALALKLHVLLERNEPGICRPVSFRTERFNQDMSPGAMLIEVGAAGDTLQQALTAAEALAEGITQLARGTATEDSTS